MNPSPARQPPRRSVPEAEGGGTSAARSAPGSAAPSGPPPGWRPPRLWRVLLFLAHVLVPAVCRLRVVDEIPVGLRDSPLILAGNHIGPFDPLALTAACYRCGLAPRILATGGLFRAPVVGWVLRRCGHLPVERADGSVVDAFAAALAVLRTGATVAGYPEGRITLDPGLWPERGRSGIARLALRTGVPVVPVAQWGAHEVVPYRGVVATVVRLLGSVWRRPVVTVRFCSPVDLSDLDADTPGHAVVGAGRVMGAIRDGLGPLRTGEPTIPRYVDPTRPVSTARTFRPR